MRAKRVAQHADPGDAVPLAIPADLIDPAVRTGTTPNNNGLVTDEGVEGVLLAPRNTSRTATLTNLAN